MPFTQKVGQPRNTGECIITYDSEVPSHRSNLGDPGNVNQFFILLDIEVLSHMGKIMKTVQIDQLPNWS